MKEVLVLGAGLAGLSLATELVDEGFKVTVLEKKNYLGGRASNTLDKKMRDPVDIGPHIFVTAYNNFRRFMKKIGSTNKILWERTHFIDIISSGKHHQMKTSNNRPNLWLLPMILNVDFLKWYDKITIIPWTIRLYFSSDEALEKLDSINAYDYLKSQGVSERMINNFMRFFVLSMLNIPIEKCSAAEFALLVKHWNQLKHHHVGFARVGLGDVYTKNAEEYIGKRGGKILRNHEVKKISIKKNRIESVIVKSNGKTNTLKSDIYVSTFNPADLRNALPKEILSSKFFRNLKKFVEVPYLSVFLWFDGKITHEKFWALMNSDGSYKFLNTDFYDKSNIFKKRKKHSYIMSNIVFSHKYNKLSDKKIVALTLNELKEAFPKMKAKLTHSHVHRIPYVIYAPFVGTRKYKLSNKTPISNFYLSGDWTNRFVQCMETAVRSGYQCADKIFEDFGIKKKVYNPKIE